LEASVSKSRIHKAVGTEIPGLGELSPDIDPEAIRAKYREERDKRLAAPRLTRPMTGSLAHYLTDPYMPGEERDPVHDEVDVVIVGAGFGGLLTAANLKNADVISEGAEAKYVQLILDKAPPTQAFLDACTPGRTNNEGRMSLRPKHNVNFGGNSFDFFNLLAEWRDGQDMAGLEFSS
jgi:hypothetical protein